MSSFFNLKAKDLNGNEILFEEYINNYILVVNTASKGIEIHQLRKLENLYQQFNKFNFKIFAFPCRQFVNRESKNNEKIKKIYIDQEKLSFNIFERIKVNGNYTHEVFKWLKEKNDGIFGKSIEWNFSKFLISPDGFNIKRFSSIEDFDSIINYLNEIFHVEN